MHDHNSSAANWAPGESIQLQQLEIESTRPRYNHGHNRSMMQIISNGCIVLRRFYRAQSSKILKLSSCPASVRRTESLHKFINGLSSSKNLVIGSAGKPIFLIITGLSLLICLLCVPLVLIQYSSNSENPFSYLQLIINSGSSSPSVIVDDHLIPTNISHLVFGISSSVRTWKNRKHYVESWWRPNITRGYLYLDREPSNITTHWPVTSPPYRIYDNTSTYKEFDKHTMAYAIRILRVISQTLRDQKQQYYSKGNAAAGFRWFVMADDDTVLLLDNLVEVLGRYDHSKFIYIGENSECVLSNLGNSFEMAFGGASYALSYPLVEALASNLDVCIARYPRLYGANHMLQSCIADFGVSLTHEKGFHQIDLQGDISGFLSAHPQSLFVSLHHLSLVDPLFPAMNHSASLTHLMKAGKADRSRLLQQTVCYQKQSNWSFSVAWGYSVQLYETLVPASFLHQPLETFRTWARRPGPYRFNTRKLPSNPCDNPHVFFFEEVEEGDGRDRIVTRYGRRAGRRPPRGCPSHKGHSFAADNVLTILVMVSPATRNYVVGVGSRRECCDVVDPTQRNTTVIKLRACMKDEIVG